jgi:hypothetical protein
MIESCTGNPAGCWRRQHLCRRGARLRFWRCSGNLLQQALCTRALRLRPIFFQTVFLQAVFL